MPTIATERNRFNPKLIMGKISPVCSEGTGENVSEKGNLEDLEFTQKPITERGEDRAL